MLLGMAHLSKTWYIQAQINVLQFCINSPSGSIVASILKQFGFLFGAKSRAKPSKCAFKKTLKFWSIFSSKLDSKMRSQKVIFLWFCDLLSQRVDCGAQGVPKGCPKDGKWYPRRPKMEPQGCQKAQNRGSGDTCSSCWNVCWLLTVLQSPLPLPGEGGGKT